MPHSLQCYYYWQTLQLQTGSAADGPMHVQDAVKGSQGAGKVDESLDRSKVSTDLDAPPAVSKPAPPAQLGKKKKGRR